MAAANLVTISCPQCQKTLPGVAVRCHFCGADLSRMQRPAAAVAQMHARAATRSNAPSWKEVAYYIVASLWILNAGFEVLQGLGMIPVFTPTFGVPQVLVVLGIVDLIFGIGLIFQNDLAMAIVKYRCILGLLNGLLGLVFAFGFTSQTMIFWGMLISNTLYLAFTGFQIYIL